MRLWVALCMVLASFVFTTRALAEETKVLPQKVCGQAVVAHINGDSTTYETKGITYTSPPQWSGVGKAYSTWYSFITPPAPAGCKTVDTEIEMVGDRRCDWFEGAMQGHWWAECKVVATRPDGSVEVQFRMQGHESYENGFHWAPNSNSILTWMREPSRGQSVVNVNVLYQSANPAK